MKKHNPTPVYIIEQESEQNTNSLIISKMIPKNNKTNFAGGFKNQSILKSNLDHPSEIVPPIQPSHIYQQLGLSIKPKYRPQVEQYDQPGVNILEKMDEQLNRMKQQRWKNFSEVNKNGTYEIANQKSKIMTAIHVPSSLDQINLQNVQAKLEAHRMMIKPIEEQYHKKKGLKMNNYLRDTNSPLKFNINLDKEMAELDQEKAKIYQLVRKRQNQQPQQIDLDELWEEKKRNNPKLAEYDAKYKEYLIQKDAKNLVGHAVRQRLFTWDKYAQAYSKKQSNPKFKTSLPKEKSKPKENKQLNDEDNNSKISDLKEILSTKDDKFIASYIMSKVDIQKKGIISKEQFYQFIKQHSQVLKGYHIDHKWLYTDLDSYPTQRKGLLNQLEIAKFLTILQTVVHPKIQLKQNQVLKGNNETSKPFTTTFPTYRPLFQKVFQNMDINDDRLLKREEYIEGIYTDTQCQKIIDKEAIRINIIQKSITYRQIIGWILDDFLNQRNQKLKKSKQYITMGRFCEYFQLPETIDLRKLEKKKKNKIPPTNQIEIIDIPQQYLQIIHDIAASIPRIYQDYFVSIDFIQSCFKDPQIAAIGEQLCRIQSIQTKLPIQTIHTTIRRMLKQSDQYSTWEQIKGFFSRRGRPLNWNQQLIKKKKQLRQKKINEKMKSITMQNWNQHQTIKQSSKNKNFIKNKSIEKYTIPKPFNITDQQPKNKNVKDHQIQQIKRQFKANPVNRQILAPKPDLIKGKTPKKDPPSYNYQQYQNDRIQRALKKAQQKYALEQQMRIIKQRAEFKAKEIQIDKKKYNEVMKEQKKQIKKVQTKPVSVSKRIYPDNQKQLQKQKIKNVVEKMSKIDEISKKVQSQKDQTKLKAKEKNQKVKSILQLKKKQEIQKEKERKKIQKQCSFKPKIQQHRQQRQFKEALKQWQQNAKKKKQQNKQKEKLQQQLFLKQQQQRKRGILKRQIKEKKFIIDGLTDEQIVKNLDQVDFEDLILDEGDKAQYKKDFKRKAGKKNDFKEIIQGIAGRQRAALQEQEARIMKDKQKNEEQRQTKNIQNIKQKVQKLYEDVPQKNQTSDAQFHRSKALRRYRAIIQGIQPLSEYDRYSTQVAPDLRTGKTKQLSDKNKTIKNIAGSKKVQV